MALLIVGWLVFAVIVGAIASGKGRSFFGWFLLSLIASPLIALVLLIAVGRSTRGLAQCDACRGWVEQEASRCRHCGIAFRMPENETPAPAAPLGGYIGLTKDGRRVEF